MACHLREKYNYTPSDFDLSFNFNQVPVNIMQEDGVELQKRLQRLMPLSKRIHLDLLKSMEKGDDNHLFINANLQLTIDDNTIDVVFK